MIRSELFGESAGKYRERSTAISHLPSDEVGSTSAVKAILVAHGIGQQRPFQVLDNFTHGLQKLCPNAKIAHAISGDGVFDHFIRFTSERLTIDIYELYWAPLTQGKATFASTASWLATTGLTPLQRFAYNIPLIAQRSRTSWGKAVVQIVRELWRVIYVSLVTLTVVAASVQLVDKAAGALKSSLTVASRVTGMEGWHAREWFTVVVFLAAILAATALLFSVPSQWIEYHRLRRRFKALLNRQHRQSSVGQQSGVGDRFRRAVANARSWVQDAIDVEKNWFAEMRTRRWLLFLTPIILSCLAIVVYTIARGWMPSVFSQNVHNLPSSFPEGTRNDFYWSVSILVLAYAVKKIYVDFIADVALYTSADENSAFFATRTAILNLATSRIRYLSRHYRTVALAGHSLGSVIMYDAIGWLRMEKQQTQIAPPGRPPNALTDPMRRDEFARLKVLITFGSPLNKVLYFFRTTVPSYETIRAHILNEIHGLRRAPEIATIDPTIQDAAPFDADDDVDWLNVYAPWDPVSAKLDFYERVDNRRFWYLLWGYCHLSYWHDPDFYALVLPRLAAM